MFVVRGTLDVEEGFVGGGGCVMVASVRTLCVCMSKRVSYHLEEGVEGEEWEEKEREKKGEWSTAKGNASKLTLHTTNNAQKKRKKRIVYSDWLCVYIT